MLSKNEAMAKFRAFVSGISAGDKVAVLHHTDADGLCSGVIAAKALERIIGKRIGLRMTQNYGEFAVTHDTVKKLMRAGINKVVTADLSVDENPKRIREIEKFAEILILDHHKIYADLNSKKTAFIKAQFISGEIEPGNYPASKLCYDLFSMFADLGDIDWICAVGILGDYSYNEWKNFVDAVNKKYGLRIGKNAYNSDLNTIGDYINAIESVDVKKLGEVFEILYNARNPKEVLQNKWMKKQNETIEKEVKRWYDASAEKSESYARQNMIFYPIRPKINVKSILINKMSREIYPSKTLIVAFDSGKESISFSARNQSGKIAVNDLLEESIKGFRGASAGGHKKAAAGRVMRADFDKWKKKLLEIAGK